jgi:glutaminyl-tRNA synthetase
MTEKQRNFIQRIIEEDNITGKFDQRVHTRFPPEPNGYLHIGHAKAICLNFNIAEEYGGKCNLRFDDTNPVAEEKEYVNAIQDDVGWLGYDWEDRLCFASDYVEQMHLPVRPIGWPTNAFAQHSRKQSIAGLPNRTQANLRHSG